MQTGAKSILAQIGEELANTGNSSTALACQNERTGGSSATCGPFRQPAACRRPSCEVMLD
jgi:hypothetical protein